MALKDLIRDVRGAFSRMTADITRRPDGGTSHYRPMKKRTAETGTGQQDMQGGLPYVHTGFTGMNPPAANYGYETMQSSFQPDCTHKMNSQAQPGNSMQMDYTRQSSASNQPSYVGMGSFGGKTEFTSPRNNISYMPGFSPNPDRTPVHVEHIITLTGLKSCYEAIECMKEGETLIVTLDAIANESESIRCQDMLAGAAFTLGCSVRLLQGARIVVIAPEGVKILPEQQNMPEGIRPPEMLNVQMTAAAEAPHPGRRERRTVSGTMEWNAARNGELNNYNPYTGTMPVAAGSYGSFGGYGY